MRPSLPNARWFNPAREERERPVDVIAAGRGRVLLRTPGDNGTGANDWVLTHTAMGAGGNR
jgi:hypothetical protein